MVLGISVKWQSSHFILTAFSSWRSYLTQFGLGSKLGIDFDNELSGNIPKPEYYDRYYGEGRWQALTVLSLAIGQGEIETTPLQMANMTATIANRGYYITPHLVKSIEGEAALDQRYLEKHHTTIDTVNYVPIVDGMDLVINGGKGSTARNARIPGITVCGKTGTAENYTKIDGKRVQLTDHSVFIAFAPKDNPKIAIAVFVENGYWGSRWAGRIASLMIEKYIKGEITRTDMENYVLKGSLEAEYAKPLSGEPFKINH